MTMKFYATTVVAAMGDVDFGNLANWQYTNSGSQVLLYKYLKTDWSNIIYVPKA